MEPTSPTAPSEPQPTEQTYRIRVDAENAVEAWWAAARAAADVPPLLAPLLAVGGADEVATASEVSAEQAVAWAASLPGWDDPGAPEYAPHPLILEYRGPQPTTYHIREECGGETTIQAPTIEAAREQAEEWIREGDYGEIETTTWVHGWIRVGDEDDEEAITVAIYPSVPGCRTVGGRPPAHDWEDESVIGHGGGVITTELCRRCRLRRTTDTWAQDPETGEQGLRSVRYDPAEPEEAE